jgi:hypothetical protein
VIQDLWTDDLSRRFVEFALTARKTLIICAPYVTRRALETLLEDVTLPAVTIVTTWEPDDVLRGASDPEIYPYLADRGWTLLLRPRLHAKLLVVDWCSALVSTANITQAGLGLRKPANLECAVPIESLTESDRRWIFAAVCEAAPVTLDYYEDFVRRMDSLRSLAGINRDVDPHGCALESYPPSSSIALPITPNPSEFVANLQRLSAGEPDIASAALSATTHDARLLSLPISALPDQLEALLTQRFFALHAVQRFEDFTGQGRYFGEIKGWLRRNNYAPPDSSPITLTQLTRNLLSWIVALGSDRYSLSRPRYSQRLTPNPAELGLVRSSERIRRTTSSQRTAGVV